MRIVSSVSGIALVGGLLLSGNVFAAESSSAPVTFTKDVAPIFQEKCEECHRPGTSAPMSLMTYNEARPWAKAIKERVVNRQMPPWHLDKTVGIQQFANDRSLNDQQLATIVKWVDTGAAQGNPQDMPAAKTWPDQSGWQLASRFGQPDLIVKSEPYTVAAHGQDTWFKPTTKIEGITEPRWVRAVEIRPGTLAGRKVTHHVLAALEQTEPKDPNDISGGAGLLMEWAIGKQYDVYRPNTGKLLLPDSAIRWEMHYHSVGEAIRDHVELGIYLYPKGEVPKYRTRLALLSAYKQNNDLDIPPNSIAQTEAFHVLNSPARIENFQPHMHLRGKGMSMEALLPDGTTQMISYVDHFNFNWMNNYIYTDDAAPEFPKGTIIKITSWYDNTTANRNNPDPNQWVGYGDRTIDEMGHAWVNITNVTEDDYKAWKEKHTAPKTSPATSNNDPQ